MEKIPNNRGFTLIEVIFTIFVIAVAVLGVCFGFLGITSLADETKKVMKIDKDIVGVMEDLRGREYDMISYPEEDVEVQLIDPSNPLSCSTTSVNLKVVTLSSSWNSLFFKQRQRIIKFYVYQRGINYRQ